jgi:hypothetical protein
MSGPITEEQIKSFAAAWYRGLDVHAPAEELAQLVADPDVEMIFPEKTLHGVDDFKAWYAGGTYSDGTETPGVIRIFFDENHNVVSVEPKISGEQAEVRVVVAWQASWFEPPAAKSKRTSLNAIQTWTVRSSTRNPYGLEITSYNAVAEPFQYAPGFAQL